MNSPYIKQILTPPINNPPSFCYSFLRTVIAPSFSSTMTTRKKNTNVVSTQQYMAAPICDATNLTLTTRSLFTTRILDSVPWKTFGNILIGLYDPLQPNMESFAAVVTPYATVDKERHIISSLVDIPYISFSIIVGSVYNLARDGIPNGEIV